MINHRVDKIYFVPFLFLLRIWMSQVKYNNRGALKLDTPITICEAEKVPYSIFFEHGMIASWTFG